MVVGFGPAGMFAALTLARHGCEPLVLERGNDVDTRHEDIERFWRGGALNPQSNVQFGEGGAGTFSDGKLTTRINDVHMKDVIAEAADKHYDGKIIIGGAAVTQAFADSIGADAYCEDAVAAVRAAKSFLA